MMAVSYRPCPSSADPCCACPADDKIQQLIATLEMRKDESIERTFKGVAKNFR